MKRNIKITEEQFQYIKEEFDSNFLDANDDTKPYDGQCNVTANGKLTPVKNGKPTTADKLQQSLTPQSYNRFRGFGNMYPTRMREGVEIDQKDDFYDVKGFDNNDELNLLTNGDEKDNLVKIPYGIQHKLDILLDAIKQEKLSEKQQAIVLNKIIEKLDYDSIPYQWKKELINDLK